MSNCRTRLLATLLLVAGSPAWSAQLDVERIFTAPELSGASLSGVQISPDGRYVTYLQGKASNKDQQDLWAWDIAARRSRLLVDSAALVPQERALSAEEEARRERARTASLRGIVSYQFAPDGRSVLVPLSGDLFICSLASQAVRQLTRTDAYETDAHFSPRGRWVSFIRNQNLVAIELASGREVEITRAGGGLVSFGVAEFIAQEEMDRDTGYWWSPDETRIAYARVDESGVDEVQRFEINANDVKVVRQRYPAAGRPNAEVQLFVATVADPARAVRMNPQAPADHYLARVNWFPDGRALAVQVQTRDQQTLTLQRIDPVGGSAQVLLTERSESWVQLNDELTFLPTRQEFIWGSRRSGYQHLYRYGYDGQLRGAITRGEWMVVGESAARAIRGVDERRGLVYFMANRETPLERHLYVAPIDGHSEPTRLTAAAGWHVAVMSNDTRVFLDSFSDPQTPPSLTLRDRRGRELGVLVPNKLDASHPYAPYLAAHLPTEFGTLPAGDGQTLYWQMIKPPNMQAGKRYPVIVDVYGGPGNQRVRRSWGGWPRSNEGYFRQILAQHGYIVFTLDNRGSGFRGVKFESTIYQRMGGPEVDDQVRGVDYLHTLPFVDATRVGVFGWSYGGYMSLMCLLRAREHFQSAVAGAPVTSWSMYDTHYTERYMGTPASNESGYAAGEVMTWAPRLRGSLLLMHGMADDNVLFTHSTVLMKKFQDLGKSFDLMTYPGSKHGLLRFASTGPHAYNAVLAHFDRTLGAGPR